MATDFRDFSGMPQDQESIFQQRFQDIDRRRRDIEQARAANLQAYEAGMGEIAGARDTAMQGARASSLMPVYSMMGQSGLAGQYSGGQAQAASQASMQGATRAAQLGATFADRIAQMQAQQAEQQRQFDTQLSDVEAAKTQLEGEAMAAVDQGIQTDMQGLREENFLDVDYFEALMRRAAEQQPGSRQQKAYLLAARDILQSDFLTRQKYGRNQQIADTFARI